jgi:hypothetical protein
MNPRLVATGFHWFKLVKPQSRRWSSSALNREFKSARIRIELTDHMTIGFTVSKTARAICISLEMFVNVVTAL